MRLVDITVLITSSLFGFFLAIFVARKRNGPGSQALSILILGASVWSIGYAFEIIASNLTMKLFWEKVEYLGIVTTPLAWFTFVAQYLGYPRWMKRILQHKVLLAVIPLITLILVWTNDAHNLIWGQVSLETLGPLVMLDFVHGPWFWVLIAFSYSLLILGSAQLIFSLFNIVRLQRWQVSLTLLAILFPWVGNLTYLTGWSPVHFMDFTAFLFLMSGVLFSVSLFRYQLANILPIAQGAIFAGLKDCVFVLDLNNRIVDMNPAARSMINGAVNKSLGKNIILVMPELISHIQQAGTTREYQAEISQKIEEEQQTYDLHMSMLTDTNNNSIGRIIVLHQITQFKRGQVKLEQARDRLLERATSLNAAHGGGSMTALPIVETKLGEIATSGWDVTAGTGTKDPSRETLRGCDRIGTRCDVRAGPIRQNTASQWYGREFIRLPTGGIDGDGRRCEPDP